MYQWVFTWGKESSLHSSTFHSVSLQKDITGEPTVPTASITSDSFASGLNSLSGN